MFSLVDGRIISFQQSFVRTMQLTKDVLLAQHRPSVGAEQLGPCALTQQPPGPLTPTLGRHLLGHLIHQGC